jgi:Uma2 family endonuclease
MMRLLAGRVRIPDIAFISNQSLPGGKVPHEAVPLLTPDLAVEVISESNTRKEMGIKLHEYFTAGTRLVWYSDPDTRSIDVYSAVDKVQHLSGEDILDGGEVLPGFQAPLPAVFDLT